MTAVTAPKRSYDPLTGGEDSDSPAVSTDNEKAGKMSGLIMKYFVLKPRGDDAYAAASRAAMHAYAKHIKAENPDLSAELIEWATREGAESHSRSAES